MPKPSIKSSLYKRFQHLARRMMPFMPKREMFVMLCSYYLDAFSGENNTDMSTDGELDFVKKNLSREAGVKIFDVGANRGNWCEAVLQINPNAEIHCFEPSNSTFATLVGRGFPKNVICNNVGLGAQASIKQLHVFADNPEWNSFHDRPVEGAQFMQEIRLDTAADYCRRLGVENIEYLKVDVEGHELAVLQGAALLLEQHRIRIVQFEYGATFIYAGSRLADMLELAKKYRYDVFKLRPRGFIAIPEYHPGLENYRNANFVLVRQES